jgi:hypothetical protein
VDYTNLGTFEFLVNATGQSGAQPFVFIETNARLQVEHIVTEEVTGLDLVQAQILLAQGSTLKELGLYREPTNARLRIQARVNMQTMCADGGGRGPWSGSFLLPAVAYENAKAVNSVTGGGIDDVIDPADTRRWIVNSLKRLPSVLPRTEKKYPYIDPW